MSAINGTKPLPRDHAKLADFILFSQREFLLNLSRDLNKDNISFAQFFLLSYLATSKELTMRLLAIAGLLTAGVAFAPGLLSWLSLSEDDDAGLLQGASDLASVRAEAAAALGVFMPHLPVPQAAAARAALGLAATPASPIAAAAFLALEGTALEVSLP